MCSSIASLNLSGNSICESGGRHIAQVERTHTHLAYYCNPVLEPVSLVLTRIRSIKFGQILSESKNLSALDLSWNAIGELAGQEIGMALFKSKKLERLNLCNCEIGLKVRQPQRLVPFQ